MLIQVYIIKKDFERLEESPVKFPLIFFDEQIADVYSPGAQSINVQIWKGKYYAANI